MSLSSSIHNNGINCLVSVLLIIKKTMQISIKPVEANLTRDTEFIGKMVIYSLFRILSARCTWEGR